MRDDPVDPRHYLWATIGIGSVIAPFIVDAQYVPFAVFMAILGGILGAASIRAIIG